MRERSTTRVLVTATMACALLAGGARAQLREVDQIIYGMD